MKFKQYYARCYRRHFACFNLYFYQLLSQPAAICLCNTKMKFKFLLLLPPLFSNKWLFVCSLPPLFFISIFGQKIVDPIRIIKLVRKIMRLWTKSLGNHHLRVNFRQIKQNSQPCVFLYTWSSLLTGSLFVKQTLHALCEVWR